MLAKQSLVYVIEDCLVPITSRMNGIVAVETFGFTHHVLQIDRLWQVHLFGNLA